MIPSFSNTLAIVGTKEIFCKSMWRLELISSRLRGGWESWEILILIAFLFPVLWGELVYN